MLLFQINKGPIEIVCGMCYTSKKLKKEFLFCGGERGASANGQATVWMLMADKLNGASGGEC